MHPDEPFLKKNMASIATYTDLQSFIDKNVIW